PYDGSFMQRGLAAVTSELYAGLGAANQLPGLGRIERGAGERDILHQFDIDATASEQHHGPHLGIERGADDELKLRLDLLRDQNAIELRFTLQLLHPRGDVLESLPDLGRAVDVQH